MAVPNVAAIPSKVHLFSNMMKFSTVHGASYCSFCHNGNASEHRKLKNIGPFFCLGRQEGNQSSSFHHPFGLQRKSRVPVLHSTTSHLHSRRPAQVKSGDSEGALSSEGMILDEETLEKDLERAIEEENYVRAAKIRDSLRVLQEDTKASVLAANARFYNAFRNGDLAAMHSIWAKGDNVYCVHPGAGRISGYDLVMGSWEVVCGADYEFPLNFELKNVEVHVRGDVGYVTCLEVVKTKGSSWGKQVATNVFERVNGQWLMSVHHASHFD